jgi:hypothetical protein
MLSTVLMWIIACMIIPGHSGRSSCGVVTGRRYLPRTALGRKLGEDIRVAKLSQ